MRNAHAKAPGKLYIAGEYAVVHPGFPAVIVAVDRFIRVNVIPSDQSFGTIDSTVLSSEPLKWERKKYDIQLSGSSEKAKIILSAMTIAEKYLLSFISELPYYDVKITSEMVSDDGLKYGLGSSGAVTVALIKALLDAFSIDFHDMLVYKLSALAHLTLSSNGSFGDLAAASFTGWVAYSSFNRTTIQNLLKTQSVRDIVNTDWPGLSIEQLSPPSGLSLLVGWTGSPASTESLVRDVSHNVEKTAYNQFLNESRQCVDRLISSFKQNDLASILKGISTNREILLKMSRFKGIELETPLLSELCRISEKYQAAGKTSGAGGGDCGIALTTEDSDPEAILTEWVEAGITPLPLNIFKT